MSDLTAGFRHKTPITVRFHDLDAFGHVNNARFLNYLEEGRFAYFRDVCGYDGDSSARSLAVIVAHVSIDYKVPVFLGDKVNLWTRISRLGGSSFDYEFLFEVTPRNGGDTVIGAKSTVTMVMYDYDAKKPIRIKPEIRTAVKTYEPALQ